jgi:hypothetical protein
MEELETEIAGILINGIDIIKFRDDGRETVTMDCRWGCYGLMKSINARSGAGTRRRPG